jgi:hypothetical protein
MGLQVRVQRARVWRHTPDRGFAALANVENVVAVLPGRNPALPALALMAHYDSVPNSPGAGDDAAGVASALEIARALAAHGQPLRDVMLVLTDGEEAGLMGAQAFFTQDPAARHVGFVINIDNRGASGRGLMFETSDGAAGAISLFAGSAEAPRSFSVFPLVFRYLPNDTDFSVARAAGVQGLNFSFMGGEADYHTPTATVARLDPGSVRSEGGQAFAVAERLAFGPQWPIPGARRVYGDVLGLTLIHYAPGVGWLVLAAAAGLVAWATRRALASGPIAWRDAAAGAGASLYALSLASALIHLARRLAVDPAIGRVALLPRFHVFEILAACLALGAALLAIAALQGARWRQLAVLGLGAGAAASLFGLDVMGMALGLVAGASALAFRRPAQPHSAWAGALVLALVVGAVCQIAAPEAAPLIVWPAIAAGAGAVLIALGQAKARWAWALFVILAGAAIAWIAVLLQLAAQGMDFAPLIGLTAWLAALVLWPLATPPPARRIGAGLVALGLLTALILRATPPWSAETPRGVILRHVTEASTGQAWRVSFRRPDRWLTAALTAEGGQIRRRAFPSLAVGYATPARPLAHPLPPVRVEPFREPGGRDGLRVTAPPGVRMVWLQFAGFSRDVRIDGKPSPYRIGIPPIVQFAAPEGGSMSFTFAHVPGHRVEVQWAAMDDPWPAEAPPLPAMPPDRVWGARDLSTVTVGTTIARWPDAPPVLDQRP